MSALWQIQLAARGGHADRPGGAAGQHDNPAGSSWLSRTGAPPGHRPARIVGLLPDQAFRAKHDWWLGQTTSAAIGQIITVTPLQLARYGAALAKGGQLLRPYLVSEVRTPAGAIVQQAQPQQTGTLAGIATADKPEIAVAVVIKRPVTARIPEDFEP